MPSRSRTSSTLAAVDQPAGVVDADDRWLVVDRVELVVQVADDRLQQILDGEDTGDATVLVDDDREPAPLPSHLDERFEDATRLGDRVRLSEPAGDLERRRLSRRFSRCAIAIAAVAIADRRRGPRRPARSGPEQVVHEEDTDEVVEIVVDDREAAVAGLPDGLGNVVGGDRDRQRGDVGPGGHDFADVHVP